MGAEAEAEDSHLEREREPEEPRKRNRASRPERLQEQQIAFSMGSELPLAEESHYWQLSTTHRS